MSENVTCPVCGHGQRVIDSRQRAGGGIRRRRVCLRDTCGHRWTTVELPADRWEAVAGTLEIASRVDALPTTHRRLLDQFLSLMENTKHG